MRITFWGAARTVTGSMHEVAVNGNRYLLDCGLYQGRRGEANQRNTEFPFPPSSVSGLILSHAHIDHSGNLPTLVRKGYSGPVYATPATSDLCDVMLRDSAYLQEKDAAYLNKRRSRRRALKAEEDGGEVEPLYTAADAEDAIRLFQPVPTHSPKILDAVLSYEAYDAGHILGSTSILLHYHRDGRRIRIIYSGDVGRPNQAIVRDPEPLPPADYLIMESTYGDRLHKEEGAVADKLATIVNRTFQRGGKLIVPAFAVGRTQQLIVLLHELVGEKRIPAAPVFVDSPLAIDATKVFRKHTECYDAGTREYLLEGKDPFGFRNLRYVQEAAESKALNDLRGPFIIISASGMCEAGRILHHLKNNIEDPRNTVLVTGFMAENTLGRKIVEKMAEVPIFGEPVRLRAEVAKLNELSGHADQRELVNWVRPMARSLKKIFLVHGEPAQSAALAAILKAEYRVEVVAPERGESFEIQ
ncbi:MAG: MBL fold metallo-hydrolase [Bryobacterales bacterium]|nr:MBL fold metallo-hydrolase [Bryobacterales bacterium]